MKWFKKIRDDMCSDYLGTLAYTYTCLFVWFMIIGGAIRLISSVVFN